MPWLSRPDRLADVAPGWLVEAVRPASARPDWGPMLRMAASVAVPLVVALFAGQLMRGLLPAMGGMAAGLADRGGSYRARLIRVSSAGAGGATGYVVGHALREAGWWAVAGVALVSVVAALVSTAGDAGSIGTLQLLVMTVIAQGVPFPESGAYGALAYLAGALWALALALAGWPFRPRAPEAAAVTGVYRALAELAEDPGAPGGPAAFDDAIKRAYEVVFGARSAASGPDAERTHLVALLNQAAQIRHALVSLAQEGRDPPPEVVDAARALAAAVGRERRPPGLRLEPSSPALAALCSAVNGAAELVGAEARGDLEAGEPPYEPMGRAARLAAVWRRVWSGPLTRVYTARLTLCMGAAAALNELHWLERSYWTTLTVALVLKPDFGSVFARAVQRGLGTVAGAVIGTVILSVVPYGPAILAPIAVFAALLPYGRQRNWGLMSTFQVPLVVLLVDLLTGGGPRLAEVRLVDTLAGCGIVLLLGYLPWPASWHAPVRPRFADAVSAIARYVRHAFDPAHPGRTALRREAFDALADLRTVFQRAVTEPAVVSRRVTTWMAPMTALEQVADATAATVARTEHGAPTPSPESVREAARSLDGIAGAVREGRPVRGPGPVTEGPLERVNRAVCGLRETLSGHE
ncbi:membrane protein [Sphaerisporangium krabiense]|uniref:Putative membrane protein YccC n=1 Tax=Sphaerisporangium krabiense TaxID=763782 RepID=A0A7W8ZCX6_9ACTN|nr:FUSC family protein [Sphaerisporangium krabiense]MBB5631682.1 putative membrane protein YccC [Sphaerisporangium krabiense]GII60681.1 membrane protein [Sphaerisporangium krabiense]